MSNRVIVGDKEVDFDYLVGMMDDDLREKLHHEMAPCTDQGFADAYLERDSDLLDLILHGAY
jgi:hypothetical protein